MRVRCLPLACVLTLAPALLLGARPAVADVGSADQLFTQAKQLMSEGKIAAACAKFEASYDADPALGALLNLADCLERDGRLASAFGRWGDAVSVAQRKGDERVTYARERREALQPKLSFVTLEVQGKSEEELFVYKGDTRLSAGAYGTALPTDPGETVIQVVRGADQVLWETKLQLAEAERRNVTVPLEEIARANPPPVKKRDGVRAPPGGSGTGEATVGFWSGQRIAGFVVGAVGLAGAGAGFALGGIAAGKASDLDQECTTGDTRYCTQAGQEIADSAVVFATASTWTLIGSGIVAAVGVTVIVTAPGEDSALEERATLSPWVLPGGGGLLAEGRF